MRLRGLLAFNTPGLEEAFQRRRNLQLMRLDATWAVMWLVFQWAGISKFDTEERRRFPATELAILAIWGAWMPLLLLLIRFRTGWYLRHRNALMCVLRLCRTLMVLNRRLPWREAKYVGSYSGVPHAPWQIYLHLLWKANLLFFGAVTFVTPLRLTIPLQLISLLATLAFTAHRCRLECGAPPGGLGLLLEPSSWPPVCPMSDADPGSVAGLITGSVTAQTCMTAADPTSAQRYYARAAALLSTALPLSGRGAGQAACLPLCFSVHAWLQAVAGVLVPLAILWALEERLRCREVTALQIQRLQQEEAVAAQYGRPPPPQQGPGGSCRLPPPLAGFLLVEWLLGSAWLLWAGLQLALF